MNILAKILFDTDLHKKYTDPSSIVGYTGVTDMLQLERIIFMQNNGITHYIHGGDLYDRGYFDTGRTINDNNFDRALSDCVKGNAYLCIGNHMYIERDNNPEFYLIQPHEKYKPVKRFTAFRPIFKAVDKLKIGTVQISFMHYNKDELYYPERDDDTTYHIAVFHTDKVLPKSFRVEAGYFGEVSSEYLRMVYANVDLAIIAHVHVPLGVRKIGSTTAIVPGSAMVARNDDREKHRYVELPIVTIYEDSSVSLELQKFSTHIESLKFHEVKDKNILPLNGENLERKREVKEMFRTELPKAKNLEEYLLNKGYNQNYINLIDRAAMGNLDYIQVRNILTGGRL